MCSTFEGLPNEVVALILSYLTSTQAIITFSQLNSRLQNLLDEYCRHVDLTSVSKTEFDVILQHQDTNQWKAFKFADNNYTPGQVNYFFENYTFIDRFSDLQCLSIIGIEHNRSYPIFIQLPSLSNLVSLEIESICGENISKIDLPNLKNLKFTSCLHTNWITVNRQTEICNYNHSPIFHRISLNSKPLYIQ